MEHQIVQSIIEITRARDTDTLEASLLSTLANLLPVDNISLINLLDELRIERCEQVLSLTLSRKTAQGKVRIWDNEISAHTLQPTVTSQINNGQMAVTCDQDKLVIYVPIFNDLRPAQLIRLQGQDKNLRSHANLVEGIAGVYTNFLRVLEDSQRDKLTGLLNRRTFDKKLVRMLELQRRMAEDYIVLDNNRRSPPSSDYAWLAIVDIDNFKRVNDDHGHIYGDEVILTVGQRMKQFFRNTDLLFRFGGEEFLVVLEPMPVARAQMALERFRDSVDAHVFPQIGGITVSIGFSRLEEKDYPPEVIDRADKALYYAKANGRNQVANYEDLLEHGKVVARAVSNDNIDLF